MQSTKIDVLVPVYNGEKYIEKCLVSIMKQTYKDINIIVLNDGSSDNTLNIVNRLSKIDSRIIVYSKDNEKSISITRNFLLEKITSKYFIFVDSDDVVSPTYIENLMNAISLTGARMACCEYTIFKPFLQKSNKLHHLKIYNSKQAIPTFVLGGRGHFMLWNKLIESSLIKDISFNESLNYGEDMFFILDVMQKNDYKIASIKNHLYYYRVLNFKSISKGGLNDNKKLFLETLVEFEQDNRYEENTSIISTWIYLTATCYLFLLKSSRKNREYRKYLKRIQKERFKSFKIETKRLFSGKSTPYLIY